mgnify:CR=1 FL=1
MTMPDDTFPTPELLARLAAGDRAAFAVVVETWQRPLAGFLGRMGLPPARVEELVQDSFVRVWLVGDNRAASRDSRDFGPVPLTDVVGRVRQIWWSSGDGRVRWERLGLVPQ